MQNEKTANIQISLKDIVDFLMRNLRLIVIGGLVGLFFSAAYVVLSPKSYEARWEFQMAQFVSSSSSGNSSINSEESAALVQRLRIPTAYPVALQQICGVHQDGDLKDYLDGKLKIEPVKNVSNAVDMKVTARSPDQARQCAEAIVTMITAQQHDLIEERLAGRQDQLQQYQKALSEEQGQLETIQKTELGNFGYLAKLDKLSWLRTRIDALREEVLLSQKHPAKLLVPVFVPSKPVSPNVVFALVLGILLGLLLGVLLAFVRYYGQREKPVKISTVKQGETTT